VTIILSNVVGIGNCIMRIDLVFTKGTIVLERDLGIGLYYEGPWAKNLFFRLGLI